MNYLFLTKTAFFNGLSENEIKTILNCLGAYQKSFKESEIIYYSGDTVSDMGLVLSGSVNIVVNYYRGSSNIFGHIGQGEIFAETYATIPNKEMLCDVVAAEKTEVLYSIRTGGLPQAEAVRSVPQTASCVFLLS